MIPLRTRWPFFLAAALSFAFGVYYLSLKELTPYHQAFIVIPFQSLPDNVRIYILGLLHIVGTLMMCLSIALFAFTVHPIRHPTRSDVVFILLFTLPPLGLLLYYTRLVGNGAPWWLAGLVIALILRGAWSSWRGHQFHGE